MSARAVFYAHVADPVLFERTGFYVEDVAILRALGLEPVVTNSLAEVWRRRRSVHFAYFYSWSVAVAGIARLAGRRVALIGGADNLNAQVEPRGLRRRVNRALAFLAMALADRVMVASEADRRNFAAIAGPFRALARRVAVVPHSVPNLDALVARARRAGPRSGAATICWMATEANVRRKGLFDVLRLLAALRGIGVELPVTVIGQHGAGSQALRRAAAGLGVEDLLSLPGAIGETDKLDVLLRARFYFQLSSWEGFGVAALEGLFAGCTVVHSGNGALAETIGSLGVRLDPAALDAPGAVEALWREMESMRPDADALAARAAAYDRGSRAAAFRDFLGTHDVR